jgi:hypothetical protein
VIWLAHEDGTAAAEKLCAMGLVIGAMIFVLAPYGLEKLRNS